MSAVVNVAARRQKNLVNYCAYAIMQVSSRGGRDKPNEDNNQKWRTNNMNKLRQTAAGEGKLLSLVALAIILLGFAAPAHAADENTVSIAVDQNAALQPAGNLYKATTNVTVTTDKPYGFNLTMQADTADLVNSKDSTHKISATASTTSVALNANQWGYALNKSATTFSAVPVATQSGDTAVPAVIADVTKVKPAGCTNPASCTKSVTFAANVDPAKLASGSYSTAITYTATAKPKPAFTDWDQRTVKVNPSEICRSGDPNSSCLVDLDKNMIPVKYTGTTTHAQWTSVANPEDEGDKGDWYDYSKKQWANAVTLKDHALSKYRGNNTVIDERDVLGYWTYIPRYAYEVMRRDGTDKPAESNNSLNNEEGGRIAAFSSKFNVKFENAKTPKKQPAACKTGKGKDYRTECGISREIPLLGGNGSTWATHSAFTFGTKELNGIWVSKFSLTGTDLAPTSLPNRRHLLLNNKKYAKEGFGGSVTLGWLYKYMQRIGVRDPKNVGGDSRFQLEGHNLHHLNKYSSRLPKNSEWSAIGHFAYSQYGIGSDIQVNSSIDEHEQGEDVSYISVSGCGPSAIGANLNQESDQAVYNDRGDSGQQSACSKSNAQRAYNGTIGRSSSSTGNETGLYDLAIMNRYFNTASYYSTLPDKISIGRDAKEHLEKIYSDVGLDVNRYNAVFDQAAYRPYIDLYDISDNSFATWEHSGSIAGYESSYYDMVRGNLADIVSSQSPMGADVFCGISVQSYNSGISGRIMDFWPTYNGNATYMSAFRAVLTPFPY